MTAAGCFCGVLRDSCKDHRSNLLIPILQNPNAIKVTVGIGYAKELAKPIISFEARLITIYEGYQEQGDDGDLAVVEIKSKHGIPKYIPSGPSIFDQSRRDRSCRTIYYR